MTDRMPEHRSRRRARGSAVPNAVRRKAVAATVAVAVPLVASSCGLVTKREPIDLDRQATALAQDSLNPGVVELARFFGDCEDTTTGITDVSVATNECEVVQILTNAYNADADHPFDIQRLGGAQFAAYYDTLNSTYAGGAPPDVAVMHASNLPDYARRDLLVPLEEDVLAEAGIDPNDWTPAAREGVTYDGRIFGVPWDLHTNLWHLNVDLFREAGLVDADGQPVLPSSRRELMQQAQQMRERTGAQYLATDANQFALSVMFFLSLVYQQGGQVIAEDGSAALDTPETREALDLMNELFDRGFAQASQDYTAAQTAFLEGRAAVLHNGTWVVNQYADETDFDYLVKPFPTLYDQPANWANSHTWVVPVHDEADRYAESLDFIAFLSDHTRDWAVGTGHLPARESVLESEAYQDAPQRSNFAAQTAEQAHLIPETPSWQPIEDLIKEEIESTWLLGDDPAAALRSLERRANQVLRDAGAIN